VQRQDDDESSDCDFLASSSFGVGAFIAKQPKAKKGHASADPDVDGLDFVEPTASGISKRDGAVGAVTGGDKKKHIGGGRYAQVLKEAQLVEEASAKGNNILEMATTNFEGLNNGQIAMLLSTIAKRLDNKVVNLVLDTDYESSDAKDDLSMRGHACISALRDFERKLTAVHDFMVGLSPKKNETRPAWMS
jgi:hypothetical protein